ncbi:hypothetical protein PANA5342_0308 [Pantoea ananatis LMG 5342]|nr:hypothetical protein PANA5342_0308 [Pantoea ananatis LMG 5342]
MNQLKICRSPVLYRHALRTAYYKAADSPPVF